MKNTLTAPQLIKRAIIREIALSTPAFILAGDLSSGENIENEWQRMRDGHFGQDTCEEWRQSGHETGLRAPFSRHYEIDVLAKKIDNEWIAWNYEHGGGKHAEFSSFDWIDDAYFVDCVEEQRVMTMRTFKKK
jgi:hypothetical protein